LFRLPQVIKDLRERLRVFDTGDDLDGTVAFAVCLNLDVEYAFQSLRPSHGGTPLGGRLRFIGCPGLVTLASFCRRHKQPERKEHLDYFAKRLQGFTRNLIILQGGRVTRNAGMTWNGWLPSPIMKSGWFSQPGVILAKGLTMHDWTPCFWLCRHPGKEH
jgi:hypothetical protein